MSPSELVQLVERLETRVEELEKELNTTRATLTSVLVERRAMLDNLKATQDRCTEHLDQYRALRRDIASGNYRE